MENDTAIVATTSPGSIDSYAAFLARARHPKTNEIIFNVIHLMEICEECKKTPKPDQCTHMLANRSGVKPKHKLDETLALYAPRYLDDAKKELYGLPDEEKGKIIPTEAIERFIHNNPRIAINQPVSCVYLGIDPGGGGEGLLGMAAVVEFRTPQNPHRLVVVGLAAISLRGQDAAYVERDAVLTMIHKLRNRSAFSRCPIVMIIECAPGIQASQIIKHVRDEQANADPDHRALLGAIAFMKEVGHGKNLREGVPKTEAIGYQYRDDLKWRLTQNTLMISSDLITLYREEASMPISQDKEPAVLDLMKTLLNNYRMELVSKEGEIQPKFKLTAKKAGCSDDMLVALAMAITWRKQWLGNRYNLVREKFASVMY